MIKKGEKRRAASPHTKGRQVRDEARADIFRILGDAPLSRDHLIENLHRLNDAYGHLSAPHMAALAEAMKLSQVEVYEVATFYHSFRVVKEGEVPPPRTVVRVCGNLACRMKGAENLRADLERALDGKADVVAAPCMGGCDRAPAVAVGGNQIGEADVEKVAAAVDGGDTAPFLPGYDGRLDYSQWRRCLDRSVRPDAVIDAVEASGLRGMGGAGFSAARKWRFMLDAPRPRVMVVNADEGEPGTFKDRYCLEATPHRVLEGALIAAWAVGAESLYIYLRDEYAAVRAILQKEITRLEGAELTGGITIHLRRGAGAYICGEETALLESLEGKRGQPRNKPPFPAQVGLFGLPTLVNNVETLYWVPQILTEGPDRFAMQGVNGAKGLRLYSVSGRVANPGVKEAPAGISLSALIEEYCGGMAKGHQLMSFLPGGASGGILPASFADRPLDFGAFDDVGCMVGSGAVVVLSQHDDPLETARDLIAFFADESCGQCTPCRIGCDRMKGLLENPAANEGLIRELASAMRDASICGLGQAAPNPVLSVLDHFGKGGS
ncbi:MAG: NAD(P)H-dependent oxidoreductase subunit E [Rhodospirillales bacterium]|nr:NAD(P)H-dependent oxidoreductase subunit E [Rhodospirillales bacterium]